VAFVALPVEVPTGSAVTRRPSLDQGDDGILHLLPPAVNEWSRGELRYVKVACDDT
jgi:hypothetical protein